MVRDPDIILLAFDRAYRFYPLWRRDPTTYVARQYDMPAEVVDALIQDTNRFSTYEKWHTHWTRRLQELHDQEQQYHQWEIDQAHQHERENAVVRRPLIPSSTDPVVPAIVPHTTSPEDIVWMREAVVSLVAHLPSHLQEMLRLHFEEGLDTAEIGARTGISPAKVRLILARTLRKLRHPRFSRRPFTGT